MTHDGDVAVGWNVAVVARICPSSFHIETSGPQSQVDTEEHT